MYYSSQEFINDLKLYNLFLEKIKGQDELLKVINYNLYRKVKSPLDYEIAIDENGKEVRQIKGRSNVSQEQITEYREKLMKERKRVLKLKRYYLDKINKIDKTLNLFEPDVKLYLREIFIEGNSYDAVARNNKEKGISKSSLYRTIRKAIDDIFESKI